MVSSFWVSILEQGLIYGIMVLGVYITYRILDFPDLSVDGSFPLGTSVTASCLVLGFNPYIACILSFIAGMAAGAATGLLHVKLKITSLLSGILVMIGLYSINLKIMGKSNIPLLNKTTIFSGNLPNIVILIIFALIVKIALDMFLKTKIGFVLRATGDNEQLVTSLGLDKGKIKIMGLMFSNGLVALSGSILAQHRGFSDVGMGTGMVVMGLASVIIGEAIFKRISLILPTTMALMGSIIYQMSVAFALKLGFPAEDLKLINAIIVIVFLALNQKKFRFRKRKFVFLGGGSPATNTKPI